MNQSVALISALAAAFAIGASAAENIPTLREVKLRERLGRANVEMELPDGSKVKPALFTASTSLAGKWKFKGLDAQRDPFGRTTDEERKMLSPKTSDASWGLIDVPMNWWSDPRFAYDKYGENDACFRGYYRRTVNVPNPADGKRRFLRFEEIGAEAEFYINGKLAGWHCGDFVPCEVEMTSLLQPGTNLVAVRVLADFGPPWRGNSGAFTRPYGAHWYKKAIRGGIWHTVGMEETPQVRIREIRIDPAEDLASIRVRGIVENAGPAAEFDLALALVEDLRDAPAGKIAVRTGIAARRGETAFDITASMKGAKLWSPDDPNLYWAAFALIDSTGRPVGGSVERFGMRTMRIDGKRFLLNGKPIYLVGDSLHSLRFGGWPWQHAKQRTEMRIMAHKASGVNTLRTAHMPFIPEAYDFADEIGVIIYNEWGNSFCNKIEEREFERNNLAGLETIVMRDYNHASVLLWSLGNEVDHRSPDVARQLDKQYDLVKRLDGQDRPTCTFSGVANVNSYGRDRLKTDFLDIHEYLGIDSDSWTFWFDRMASHIAQITKVYGENGELKMPLVMWECVGAGWCIRSDRGMRPGDVARYVDWMKKWCSWGKADGIPFSASVGLLPLLDPKRGQRYVQGYLAARLCELFRQDHRLAGFAPWLANPAVPGYTRWYQQVYPLLRNNARNDGRLFFRQLSSPDMRDVECVVVNDTDTALDGLRMEVTLAVDNREVMLGTCEFGTVGVFEEGVRPLRISIPSGLSGEGEVRLRLTGPRGLTALNGYQVRLHSSDHMREKAAGARELTLSAVAPKTEAILRELGIMYRISEKGKPWPSDGTVDVPPGTSWFGDEAERFVRDGGVLLVLEPAGSRLYGFPELYVAPGTNHLVEPVAVVHPAFDGLSAFDFDTWAENPHGAPVARMVMPLDTGVIACRPRYIHDPYKKYGEAGMALCEYRLGKGRIVVSTLNAERLWGVNPAATRYMRNLLAYVARGRYASGTLAIDEKAFRPVPKDVISDPLVLVERSRPFGLKFSHVEKRQEKAPAKILFFKDKLEKLKKGGYRYLTLAFRSSSDGYFDVTIPKSDHRNRLTCTIPAEISRGKVVTVRLDLSKDFRFAMEAKENAFGLDAARGEIIFYNGYENERTPPFPRPPVEVEIVEMRFE